MGTMKYSLEYLADDGRVLWSRNAEFKSRSYCMYDMETIGRVCDMVDRHSTPKSNELPTSAQQLKGEM